MICKMTILNLFIINHRIASTCDILKTYELDVYISNSMGEGNGSLKFEYKEVN